MTKSEAIQELYRQLLEMGVDTPHKRACDMVLHCGVNEPKSHTFNNNQKVAVEIFKLSGYEIWWSTGSIWPQVEIDQARTSKLLLL